MKSYLLLSILLLAGKFNSKNATLHTHTHTLIVYACV